jgi:hypothetical protein
MLFQFAGVEQLVLDLLGNPERNMPTIPPR